MKYRSGWFAIAVALVAVMLTQEAKAIGFGAGRFAAVMNRGGGLYHDQGFRGAEVVYRSSGRANRWQAKAAWRRSPGHNALLSTGKIRRIRCRGSVCVGRGR